MFAAVAEEGRWLGTEAGFDVEQRRATWLAGLDEPRRQAFVAVTDDGAIVANATVAVTALALQSNDRLNRRSPRSRRAVDRSTPRRRAAVGDPPP